MTRDEALQLMHEHTQSPALRQHMLAVEAARRAHAGKDGDDPQAGGWGGGARGGGGGGGGCGWGRGGGGTGGGGGGWRGGWRGGGGGGGAGGCGGGGGGPSARRTDIGGTSRRPAPRCARFTRSSQ